MAFFPVFPMGIPIINLQPGTKIFGLPFKLVDRGSFSFLKTVYGVAGDSTFGAAVNA